MGYRLREDEAVMNRPFELLKGKYPERHTKHMDIGEFTYGKPEVIECGEGAKLHIGKFCSIADDVTVLLGGNHRTDWITTYPFNSLLPGEYGDIKGHPATKGDVCIGNDVWIGRGALILSGVRIGNGAVIGANAVVTHHVFPYSLVAGNPATRKKSRFEGSEIRKLIEMNWWDWDVDRIAEAVPLLQSDDISKLYEYWKGWKDA